MTGIRAAREADAPGLPAIERSAAQVFATLPPQAWTGYEAIQSVARHLELIAGGYAWVAVDDQDTPVSFLNGERFGSVLHLWELDVRYDQQGRGVGRALLRHAVQAASRQVLDALTLTTFRDVPWNAPFYQRIGFQIIGEDGIPNYLKQILEDEARVGLPRSRRCAMRLSM